jgi:diaminopimelate epimerase
MYNRDGSEGDMCGNGIRCFARYVYDHRLTTNTQLCIETRAGIMRSRLVLDGDKVHSVEVNMGKPGLRPEDIPMRVPDGWMSAQNVPVCVGATTYSVTGVKMGNPNGVVFVHNLEDIDVARDGRLLELSPVFTEGANIEFVQVLAPELIKMKVWERGSGETLSCGTGACAALVAAANSGSTRRAAEVLLPGGRLYIEWRQDGDVMMTGPANEVCSGVFTRWTRQHDYVVTSVG